MQRIWTRRTADQAAPGEDLQAANDEHFVEKVRDIVGLYIDPPDKALVLPVDEKSQIQAIERTQPGLSRSRRAEPAP